MPRLFSGIEMPTTVAQRLNLVRAGLNGARWIDPANYHLTLRFIGDVDGITARDFAHGLGNIMAPPFELRLQGLSSFGGRKPRAIFASVAPSEALQSLQRAHERAARAAGLPPEPRNFTPHVTVARLKGSSSEAVATYLERHGGFLSERFEVNRFVLFSSRASIGGGPYVVEAAYPLEDDFATDYDDDGVKSLGEELG
jgi:2'-5' RNA ligase